MAIKELKLKVAEAVQDDVNKGIVRVDTSFMHQIGIRPGDIVEIEGERKTVSITDRAYPGDIGLNIIRMDGLVRRNAKTGIGETVKVRKAEVKEAKKVLIAPARKGIIVRAGSELFKQGLLGRALVKGDIISLGGTNRRRTTLTHSQFEDIFRMIDEDILGFGFGDIKFIVVDTLPKQAVIVSDLTEIVFNPEAIEVLEEKPLEVTYEDIGGLKEEIEKIREMVELPLKHPEIFERLGIEAPKGVLLHGPPGTGKTLLAKAVANETNAHFILINGPEIMCVDGDTYVLTNPKGFVKAKEIFENVKGRTAVKKEKGCEVVELSKPIKTYSYKDGKVKKSKITHVIKLKAKSYRVALSDGAELITSANQPFLTYENGRLKWQRVALLKEGDFVAKLNKLPVRGRSYKISLAKSCSGIVTINGKQTIQSRNLSRSNFVKLPEKTSTKLMMLLGLLFSDGNISKERDAVTFTNQDKKLLSSFKKQIAEVFSIGKRMIKEYRSGKDVRVVVYSKVLARLFELLGIPVGNKAKAEQHIPHYLYSLPEREVSAFVAGYFEGDGTVALTKTKNLSYPTPKIFCKSKVFLQEMQAIIQLRLGISTKLNKHNTPLGRIFELVVRGNSGRVKFAKLPLITKKAAISAVLKTGRIKEFENIPYPDLLINEIRNKLPYDAYRNHDYYIYKSGRFTKHALNRLYNIAVSHGLVTEALSKEFELLTKKNLSWERVNDITELGEKELYDFTVDDDSFVGHYYLLHNSKFYGESEQNLRRKFGEAEKNAPSIIFIDEIDAIASKREEVHGEVERRVVAQLLALMDGLKSRGKVVVIAASNVPNLLDPALRRPGRFDREIEIGVPGKEGRLDILKIHTRNMPLDHWDNQAAARNLLTKINSFEDVSTKRIEAASYKLDSFQQQDADARKEMKKLMEELNDLEEKRKYSKDIGIDKILNALHLKKSQIIEAKSKIEKLKEKIESLTKQIEKIKGDILIINKRKEELKGNTQKVLSITTAIADIKHTIFIRNQEDVRNIFSERQLKQLGEELGGIIIDLRESEILSKDFFDEVKTVSIPIMLANLAAVTHGFVGADLAALCKEAAMIVLRKVLPDLKLKEEEPIPKELLERLQVTEADFKDSLKVVRPSAMREVLIEMPNIKWGDIGGLDDVKQELKEAVEWPIKNPEDFKRLGIKPPRGILLYGPPGTGKTLLAKAVATESEANFILVKGPELLSKWVGESEKAVREIFKKARQVSPSIIFFDEIDSLAPKRGLSADSHVSERVVNQLLTEMDGLEDLYNVVILAATNRPDMIDPALLRPGRFDRLILTPVPDEKTRMEIFKVHTKGIPINLPSKDSETAAKEVAALKTAPGKSSDTKKKPKTEAKDKTGAKESGSKDSFLSQLASKTEGYTGADIEAVCREAAIFALRKNPKTEYVTKKDFEEALQKVGPSVTKEIEEAYQQFTETAKKARAKALTEEKPAYMG